MKLNPKELALGNYVEYANIRCIVRSYSNSGFLETNGLTAPITAYDPIKITDDLLSDLGYTKVKDHFHLKLHCIWKCNDIYLCDKNGTVLTYLHQLQNLLFFTKGIEITL